VTSASQSAPSAHLSLDAGCVNRLPEYVTDIGCLIRLHVRLHHAAVHPTAAAVEARRQLILSPLLLLMPIIHFHKPATSAASLKAAFIGKTRAKYSSHMYLHYGIHHAVVMSSRGSSCAQKLPLCQRCQAGYAVVRPEWCLSPQKKGLGIRTWRPAWCPPPAGSPARAAACSRRTAGQAAALLLPSLHVLSSS
jgi:hypothetical protein